MKVKLIRNPLLLSLLFTLAVGLVFLPNTIAQEEGAEETEAETAAEDDAVEVGNVVVVGNRVKPRSVLESPVPIDIVSNEDFQKQGGTDLPNLLRTLVPSYNVNTQPISDAGTVVRPANLRGLAPDHTLVLINNKRRHRAAVIHWLGNGLADGAQGPDLSPIPSIALQQVEVLRDGASAQYGSDAIAGVMNFQLKDSNQGGSLEFKPGIYQYGDGRQFAVAGNIGLGTPETWANLSIEYGAADPTIRSVQRRDATALLSAGNMDVRDPAQIWGQPIVDGDLKFFANYGSTLNDELDFYGYANYASKRVEGGFYFRNPNTRSGVFSKDSGETLLVGDLRGLPEGVDPTEDDIPIVDDKPNAEALENVFNDPNLWTFQEMFPGGFTPRFGANMVDSSVLLGIKGSAFEETLGNPLAWDLSGYFGRNHADYFIFNTVNASLGPDTPTSFNPGDYIQTDYNVNFDVTYPVHQMVDIAAGLEYRNEGFEIAEGQKESWEIGPLATQGFTPASNGFSGFGPNAAGVWTRYNIAAYVEGEITPLENWLVALAVRGEDFEIFGSTVNYKVATNYGITETMKLRGSYSSGFRAPTPGQQNAFNITTEFDFDKGDLVNTSTVPSTHPASALFGGEALEPETSQNFTGGFTVEILEVNVTIDFFDIRMKDRLSLSQEFELEASHKEQLDDPTLDKIRFFTNDFDSITQGIDAVVTVPVLDGSVIAIYNFTQTEVVEADERTIDDDRIKELETNLPKHRASLTVAQPFLDNFGVLARGSFWGDWYDSEDDASYTGKFIVDLEVSYTADSGVTFTLGGTNILDTYPDENPAYNEDSPATTDPDYTAPDIGNKYGQFSPFGFDGAFWYAKIGYSF